MTSTAGSAGAADPAGPPVTILLGTTASGKTAVSIPLARALGAEILALDSKQVLAGMPIGTAQPSEAEREEIPHHLFGVVDPRARFSAGDYGRLAREALAALEARGGRGLFVGGSGLYLRALLGGLAEGLPHDADLRSRLRERAASEGSPALHAELAALDPESAARLHANDAQRITRALEVVLLTGAPMGALWRAGESPSALAARCRLLVLVRPREEIYARIARRTDELLSGGMIEEAAGVLASGVDPESPTFKAHGYPEIALHLAGTIDRDELTRRLNQVTRNYAKRQMTWFRRLPNVLTIPVSGDESPAETALKALKRLEDIT